MFRAGVADALGLAALRKNLTRRELEALVEDALAQRQRGGRALAQLTGPFLRLDEQRVRGGPAIGDAQLQCFVSVHLPAAEDQFLGPGQADPARQEVHAAAVRDQPAMDVRPREARRVARDDEIASQRRVRAEPGGCAVDGRDGRLGHVVQQRLRVVHPLLALPAVEGDLSGRRTHAPLHAGDVAAGAEPLAVAGQDQGPNRLVGSDPLQRGDELGAHVVTHGVALIRAVQEDGGDARGTLQFDQCRVGHLGVPQSSVMLALLTTLRQRTSSHLTYLPNSSAVPALITRPSTSTFLRNSSAWAAFFAAAFSRAITGAGVRAGANRPYQLSAT